MNILIHLVHCYALLVCTQYIGCTSEYVLLGTKSLTPGHVHRIIFESVVLKIVQLMLSEKQTTERMPPFTSVCHTSMICFHLSPGSAVNELADISIFKWTPQCRHLLLWYSFSQFHILLLSITPIENSGLWLEEEN